MKSNFAVFIIGLIFIILTDTAFGFLLRKALRRRWALSAYTVHSLFFVACLILFHFLSPRVKGPESYFWIGKFFGVLILFYTPKLIYIILNTLGLLLRNLHPTFHRIMRWTANGAAILLFGILLYSITGGRYNYRTDRVEVPIAGLDGAFDGFSIIQLSDLHLGSYGESYKGIQRLVEEVNALQPDMIVFTGDMINNFADEMTHWIPILQQLEAPFGKYAVTGNHDYGQYVHWDSPRQEQENLQRFFRNMETMGFHMLNNTHVPIPRANDTLWLAGVENWGNPPFPRYGNLDAALAGIGAGEAVVLLSHDPSHWRGEVLGRPVALMLSGHTHAMQSGVRIAGWTWSPSQYIYPEYDGLYREGNQYLHVSRGQGYLGYPGRIGLRPVITELILKPSGKPA